MATLPTSATAVNLVNGTANADTLTGTSGQDLIDGGAGNDALDGKAGSDIYKFGRLSGNDTISESYDSSLNTDAVLLDAGITTSDVTLQRDGTGDTLVLRIKDSTNVLKINKFFYNDGASNPYGVEEIRFADGATWNKATVMKMVIQPTAGNDTIVGYATDDVLDGGAGNDWLDGREGSDTYKFGRTSGNDTIAESYDTKLHKDAVLLDAGITPDDVMVQRDGTGDSLVLRIKDSTSVLTISKFFYNDGAANPYGVEEIRFANGNVWSKATVMKIAVQPTAGNDTIVGYATDDVLDGGAGNDWLDGRGGSDVYLFGRSSGNDTIAESYDTKLHTDAVLLDADIMPSEVTLQRDGTDDNLILRIKDSTSVLKINKFFYNDGAANPYGLEEIRFADGTVWNKAAVMKMVIQPTTGNDTIVGYFSDDVLDGGAGNDWFDGRGGSDVYKFGRSSGNDTIAESYDTRLHTDAVLLDADITPSEVTLQRDGTDDNLVLRIKDSTSVLKINKFFYNDGAANPYGVEEIRFADGTVWNKAAVMKMVIQPTAGNDTIVGYFTDDVLDGGAGNDWFDGRGGSDVYKFGRTSGSDRIAESYDTKLHTDAVLLDAGITPSDVMIQRDGTDDNLVLRIKDSTSVLELTKFFYNDGAANPYGVEEIRFADSTVWNKATVMKMVIQPTAGNDTIVGYFSGDILDGGAGNDWLDGRGGSDTYKFGIFSGSDTISESYDSSANTDQVLLGAGINQASVKLARPANSDSLVLSIFGTTDTLTIKNYFYRDGASPYAVEQIKFNDGSVWTYAMVKAMVAQGTTGFTTTSASASRAFAVEMADDALYGSEPAALQYDGMQAAYSEEVASLVGVAPVEAAIF